MQHKGPVHNFHTIESPYVDLAMKINLISYPYVLCATDLESHFKVLYGSHSTLYFKNPVVWR